MLGKDKINIDFRRDWGKVYMLWDHYFDGPIFKEEVLITGGKSWCLVQKGSHIKRRDFHKSNKSWNWVRGEGLMMIINQSGPYGRVLQKGLSLRFSSLHRPILEFCQKAHQGLGHLLDYKAGPFTLIVGWQKQLALGKVLVVWKCELFILKKDQS